jgi:hypothetical protein
MAHAYTIAKTVIDGEWSIRITETGAQASDEVPLNLTTLGRALPDQGRVLRVKCAHGSGSATEIQPVIGTAPGVAGVDVIFEADATEVSIVVDEAPTTGSSFRLVEGALYFRSRANSGSNNAVTTIIELVGGRWS